MQITVTQQDINFGVQGGRCTCPVAVAIRRILAAPYYVLVYGKISLRRPSSRITKRIDIPDSVRTFVTEFDRGNPVQPFDFDIEIPEKYLAKLE